MKHVRYCLFALLCGILILPLTVLAERGPETKVVLQYPDSRRLVSTSASTVEQVLQEHQLKRVQFRKVFPAFDSPLVQGMHIFLYPEKPGPATGSKRITPSRQVLMSGALPKGRRIVIQGGRHGLRRGENIVRPASTRVVMEGYSRHKSHQLKDLKRKQSMRLLATGYSPHRLDTAPYDDGLTAIGLPAGYGVAAVDPRVIPLGTELYVQGYGYAIAADVGGEIEGKRIDLCFNKRENALKFGRRRTTVFILG